MHRIIMLALCRWLTKRQLRLVRRDIAEVSRLLEIKRATCLEIEGETLPELRLRESCLLQDLRELDTPIPGTHTPAFTAPAITLNQHMHANCSRPALRVVSARNPRQETA